MNHKLRAARKKMCWTMAKVSEKAQVSVLTYSRWEHGEQEPRPYNLELLCKAFKMSPEDLGFAEMVPESPVQVEQRDTKASTLHTLTAEQVDAILSLLVPGDGIIMDEKRRKISRGLAQILAAAPMITIAGSGSVIDVEPWERLITGRPSNIDAATITHFEKLTQTGWEMSNGSELAIAEQILPTFLPKLIQLAPYQPEVASLASQGLQLNSILAAHRLKISDKIQLCQQAVDFARRANDANILVAALIQLAVAYQYAQQPENALKTYQEALLYCHQASPLLQARVYVESAASLAKLGRGKEALFYLGLAYEAFPSHPEQDPSYLFADCPYPVLFLYEGQTHLDLGQPQKAWEAFAQVSTLSANVALPERIRLEIVNHQGKAALLSNDLEKYALCLEDGMSGAVALKSKKRFDEATSIYRQVMPSSWHSEPRIKDIAERFYLGG